MTVTLPLNPQEEAKLRALAHIKGISMDALVQEAVNRILADGTEPVGDLKDDSRPIWDMILDNMKDVPPEEFAKLPRDGASEVDHYLHGHPKRGK
jgi:hypothetical protein